MNGYSSPIRRRLRLLRQLRDVHDILLFMRIFCFAVIIPLLMRLRLAKLASLLELGHRSQTLKSHEISKIVQYVDMAMDVGRPLIRPGCLTRGVTSYYFLRRAGADVKLYFGMGKPDEEYGGHCWIVKDGEPFLEKRDPRPVFTVMYTIPQ